ncbi:MAG: hypothetical protein ABUL55_03200 [Pseudomonadota bacterium]
MARPRKGEFLTVEDASQVQDHPERGRIEALMDQNLFRSQIRRERSAAFWMAASIWGTGGLVIGACFGAYMMYVATNSSLPIASDALARGMAVEQARSRVDSRPPLMQDDQTQQQQQQNGHER